MGKSHCRTGSTTQTASARRPTKARALPRLRAEAGHLDLILVSEGGDAKSWSGPKGLFLFSGRGRMPAIFFFATPFRSFSPPVSPDLVKARAGLRLAPSPAPRSPPSAPEAARRSLGFEATVFEAPSFPGPAPGPAPWPSPGPALRSIASSVPKGGPARPGEAC